MASPLIVIIIMLLCSISLQLDKLIKLLKASQDDSHDDRT